jgi:hypothetical protein
MRDWTRSGGRDESEGEHLEFRRTYIHIENVVPISKLMRQSSSGGVVELWNIGVLLEV